MKSSLKDLVELYLQNSDLRRVAEAHASVLEKREAVDKILDKLKGFSRKEQAKEIVSRWHDWRRGYAFSVLDNGGIDDDSLTKILLYELEQ